ncbi:hypothetical protein V2G26_014908 [Clonostachys chloroleuca]
MWQRDNYENRQVRKSRLVDSIYDITIHLSAETRGDSDHIFVESAREQARRVGPYSYNPGIASSPSTAQQPATQRGCRCSPYGNLLVWSLQTGTNPDPKNFKFRNEAFSFMVDLYNALSVLLWAGWAHPHDGFFLAILGSRQDRSSCRKSYVGNGKFMPPSLMLILADA